MPESKNSWVRGIEAENRVKEYLLKNNFKLIEQRYRTPFGEVDLLLQSPKGPFVLIEVKTISDWQRLLWRIDHRQKQRLKRACSFIENKYKKLVILKVAYIDRFNKILFLDI